MKSSQPWPDCRARQRFCKEIEQNFSVIAPAGVGKTRAIVHRVVTIALANPEVADQMLPRLVVVTYTRKAAEEMQERTRNELLQQGVSPEGLARFNQVYFGTIHSFCLKLLRIYGHFSGLPATFALVENHPMLWLEFMRSRDAFSKALPESIRDRFLRHVHIGRVAELARWWRADTPLPPFPNSFPDLDFKPLLKCFPNQRSPGGVEEGQGILRDWLHTLENEKDYLPLPVYKKGGKDFQKLWQKAFHPLRDWLQEAALALIANVAREYRNYRVAKGWVTYQDMVTLAAELLRHPAAGPEIRGQRFRVILDEAQDTDREQFEVLLELVRPSTAKGNWLAGGGSPPEAGRFCMVGDPQQSIFSTRADLPTYREVHHKLQDRGLAQALTFEVTFRCDRKIVAAVNHFFPYILNHREGQVKYEPLTARPEASPGGVVRCRLNLPSGFDRDGGGEAAALSEARALAGWVAQQGLSGLGIRQWCEVAVLSPRKRWLPMLAYTFEEVGLPILLQSRGDSWGDNPAYAWLTALVVIMAEPDNAFELVGVLREIFGISDHDIATFVSSAEKETKDKNRLQIGQPIKARGPVATALNFLVAVREETVEQSLRDAVSRLIERLRLRERLNALPGYPPGFLSRALDGLLVEVAMTEEKGLSLVDLAGWLRERFSQEAEEEEGRPDQLRLITCHKAKGLEWEVVIIPFLFREIRFQQESYPRLLDPRTKVSPLVVLDKHQDFKIHKEEVERERRQEYERLLYVTLTRARRRLLLMDTADFFPNRRRRNTFSFAELLGVLPASGNRDFWLQLPETLTVQPPSKESERREAEPEEEERVLFDRTQIAKAQRQSRRFIERVTPSTLAHLEGAFEGRREPDLAAAPAFPEVIAVAQPDYTAYGNWWHRMMETNLWSAGVEAWRSHFEASLASCPERERGEIEIACFRESPLAALLARPAIVVRTEVPLLWQADVTTAYEGFIDLTVWDPEEGRWFIIDWKTDRKETELGAMLKGRYTPQVTAYLDALYAIFREPVRAMIYSTVTGEWLAVGEKEWASY